MATLRQILFTHLRSREEEEGVNRPNGAVQMNTSPASSACEENRAPEDKENPQLPSAPEGLLQTAEQNGGLPVQNPFSSERRFKPVLTSIQEAL